MDSNGIIPYYGKAAESAAKNFKRQRRASESYEKVGPLKGRERSDWANQ